MPPTGAPVLCNDRTGVSDPIDVVTGEMVMQHTDLSLLATLALELRRVHISRLHARPALRPRMGEQLGSAHRGRWLDAALLRPRRQRAAVQRARQRADAVAAQRGLDAAKDGRWIRRQSSRWSNVVLTTTSPLSARLSAITEPGGQRITLGYDPTGRLDRVTHRGGYVVLLHTEHGRIVALHLVNLDDGREHLLSQYSYDDARLARHATDGGSALTYAYDAAGRIVRWQDRRGTWFGYRYDERGRCVATSGLDGILADRFRYDAARRLTNTDALGHSTTYQYNALLQVTQVTDALGATTRTERDARGRVLRETDRLTPFGRTTSFDYGERGHLERIVRADGSRYGFEHDEANRCTRVVDPLGAVRTHRYNAPRTADRSDAARWLDLQAQP